MLVEAFGCAPGLIVVSIEENGFGRRRAFLSTAADRKPTPIEFAEQLQERHDRAPLKPSIPESM